MPSLVTVGTSLGDLFRPVAWKVIGVVAIRVLARSLVKPLLSHVALRIRARLGRLVSDQPSRSSSFHSTNRACRSAAAKAVPPEMRRGPPGRSVRGFAPHRVPLTVRTEAPRARVGPHDGLPAFGRRSWGALAGGGVRTHNRGAAPDQEPCAEGARLSLIRGARIVRRALMLMTVLALAQGSPPRQVRPSRAAPAGRRLALGSAR